jgi:hypoxanthine-DNA glycosylase
MNRRSGIKGFDPLYTPGSRALILGSYPSPKSFEQNFYYGHPQNRFWPLLAALLGRALPTGTENKKALVLNAGLAVWDSLESCTITGASDASIQNPVPNDIAWLLSQTRVRAIFCNGTVSHRIYRRFCQPKTGIAAVCLPSTSPANAGFGLERLIAAWQPVARALRDAPTQAALIQPASPAGKPHPQ